MRAKQLALTGLFTALVAVGAFLKIPVPPVPITLQLLFTTLAGLFLGEKWGTASVLCYLLLGICGIPVFTHGGGIGYVLQPTFGYLLGFVSGTFLTARIAARRTSFWGMLVGSLVGMLAVYACGAAYFWAINTWYLGTAVTAQTLLVSCFLLFLPGDTVLCVLAALLGKRLRPVLQKIGAADGLV